MTRTAHIRRLHLATAVSLCLAVPCIGSAQNLPPSAATRLLPPSGQTPAQPLSQPALPSQFSQSTPQAAGRYAGSRDQVKLASGLLSVTTENASLNEVLREISRVTGMRIIGAIADERVFGSYGPAPPQEVLSQLLEGTGTNILLHEDAEHAVRELTLTARQGGITPPGASPPARRDDNENDIRSQMIERRRHLPGNPPDQGQGNPPDNSRQPPPETQPVFPQSQTGQPGQAPQILPNGLPAPSPENQQRLLQQHVGGAQPEQPDQ